MPAWTPRGRFAACISDVLTVATPLAALYGCAPVGEPRIEAHRGAAGYHPQNSRTAVSAALEAGWDALEFDLVLTADGVPVLSHDPWVHETLCTRADGSPLDGRIRVDGLSLQALTDGFVCGGLPDPEHPNASLVAEPVMALDEVLTALRTADPDLVLHLDLKVEPGWTPPADVMADAVLSRWFDADPPHRFYVSANTVEGVAAVEDWGRAHGRDVRTSLAWPRFPVDEDPTRIGLSRELGATLGAVDPLALAEQAGADGLALYWELARLPEVRRARDQGFDVQLWTLNERAVLRHHARWPVTALITDYPGDLP